MFLVGKKTNLRPIKESEVPQITCWINDPEVRKYINNILPFTERQEMEWYKKLGSDEKNLILGIETKEGKLIGTMGIHGIDPTHRCASTGTLIGEKSLWGNGFGSDAKMSLLYHAFYTMNLNKINSSAFEFNERSIRYSLRCGYQIEGRRRAQFFREGRYWGIVLLGVIREEWIPLWEKYTTIGSLK